jgi:hypothetical protein
LQGFPKVLSRVLRVLSRFINPFVLHSFLVGGAKENYFFGNALLEIESEKSVLKFLKHSTELSVAVIL